MEEQNKEILNSENEKIENEDLETSDNQDGVVDDTEMTPEQLKQKLDETNDELERIRQEAQEKEGKNKQLYERTKKAENTKKKLEAKMYASSGEKKEESGSSIFELAKKISALRDYSTEELKIVERMSNALGVDEVEASQHDDTQTLIKAHREKQEKINKTTVPSGRQSIETKDFSSWTPDDVDKIDTTTMEGIEKMDEYRKWAKNRGW